jgi:predicted GNAT family acetyltransferase
MAVSNTAHILDNPIWNALNTEQAYLASGTSLAKRFPPDVNLAVAVADHSEAAFHDLTNLVPSGEVVAIAELEPPSEIPGWTIHERAIVLEMVCQGPVPEIANPVPFARLTNADVPDMLALIELTKPGPFLPRTIEMGRYFGIRQEGQLVAMAGERFRLPGYCELSAVCTHPDHQGKGYARQLVSFLVNDHFKQGITPLLHVAPANTRARSIYETLNFRHRCDMNIIIISH